MGETGGAPDRATERRESSERDEQAELTEYLDALVVRTEAAMRPRPADSARRRGRRRRLRRRATLGVAAAIVVVVSVLGVLSADLGGVSRGGPATTEPLNPGQLPPEVAPWELTRTSKNYEEFMDVAPGKPTGMYTGRKSSTDDPGPISCDDTRPIGGIRLVGVRHAGMFRYTSRTSPTASFSEIVISFSDRAEAIRVADYLDTRTGLCHLATRTDQGETVDISVWRQRLGERVEFTAIARRDTTVVFLLYGADAVCRPQLPLTLAHAAVVQSGDATY
ncbi:hypothetical protein [Embleya sp. NPDC050493]|uniref:hypothetical protein n=1 Tax=Embleya sp. NPDC050493 TaxID=3363989 RepID=UPI0037A99182